MGGVTVVRQSATVTSPPRRRNRGADTLFFPAAALYGAMAVPLSLHGLMSGRPLLPGFGTPLGHAHELLFGFALAIVTGFLVTRIRATTLWLLFGFWLSARVSYALLPDSPTSLIANVGFAALLALVVVPRFVRSAKKLRNRVFGPLILALCLSLVGFHLAPAAPFQALQHVMVREGVVLFAALMLFMGGRIIAPAAAGAIQRAGGRLEARVQPRIEALLLALMLGAIGALTLPRGDAAAGGMLILAGALVAVRLIRWRLWRCRGRPDLWCLGAGYLWLAVGLLLLGGSWWLAVLPPAAATHAITIGALGTLSAGVMIRVRSLRAQKDPARIWMLSVIVSAISVAAVLRIGGQGAPTTLGLAAGCWSAGQLLLLLTLWRTRRLERPGGGHGRVAMSGPPLR